MKTTRFLILILFLGIFLNGCKKDDNGTPSQVTGHKIAFATDIHFMAPELLVQDGPAFQAYLASDPKLLAEGPALLQQLITQLNSDKPDLFVISGDITKDGELASHQGVINMLQSQLDPSIKVLLVPGNHDIANPNAVSYNGSVTSPVPTVTTDQFVDLYQDFGYGTAVARDAGTLSYVGQPFDDLRIIFIDATIRPNPHDPNETPLDGEIPEATLQWITTQAAAARSLNMQVFAVMHHNLMSHWTGQSTLSSGYVLDNSHEASQQLFLAGIRLIFTGHSHNNDVVKSEVGNLFDIETGSLVAYPLPYRTMNFWRSDSLEIATRYITGIQLHGYPAQEYAQNFLDSSITSTVMSTLTTYFLLPDTLALPVAQSEADAFLELCNGDEELTSQDELQRDQIVNQLTLSGFPAAAATYRVTFDTWNTDLPPQDNTLSIILGK